MTLERGIIAAGAGLLACAALYGCASYPTMNVAPPSRAGAIDAAGEDGPGRGASGVNDLLRGTGAEPVRIPGATPSRPAVVPATAEEIAALIPDEPLNAILPPQPLAQYLNTVFAEVLRVPYSLGPGLGARTEIITVNAPATMSRRQYVVMLQSALRSYGLVLSISRTSIQITEEGAGVSGAAQSRVIRSRSSADTPVSGQVIQFFQLVALRADGIVEFVRTSVGSGVTVEVDSAANALLFSGQSRNVATAVDLVRNLDQPAFAGAQVIRLQPTFWAPDAFAQALAATMTAEGYVVSTDPLGPKSVMIVPLINTNQTLVFAADTDTMARVQYWARELDQPSQVGDATSTFVYEVQNTSAAIVGQMLINAGSQTGTTAGRGGANAQVAGAAGQPGGAAAQAGRGATAAGRGGNTAANTQTVGGVPTGGSITVDEGSNRILFTGSPSQFSQLRSLLRQLDMPARQVLVEVTIAEVTLTDETRAGLEFFFTQSGSNGTYTGGTRSATGVSGLNLGTAGLNIGFDNGVDLQAAFNAFASNSKVNILSRPRLTARSGTAAEINVGADVPIIIGQRAANTGGANGDVDVTQQIQYRPTGVILQITPTVYGDDRVDIQIYQEVSGAQENPNPAIQSPIISNRNLTTTLSLADGQTAVLGGLIQDDFEKTNRGVPFLKDLPLFGQAFRVDSVSGAKTEMVVLITPFIIRDDADMAGMAQQATDEMNNAFRSARGSSYTLTPWAAGISFAGDPPNPRVTGGTLQRPADVETEAED